ncbi:VacJ family lipoprotein [Phenylobacterium sp.]|jgi:phospholipid-binding lipoprotein MlaA|uniref:MlaA family lipoprotein n=1 Tax=Phenylobacterium sp. TaxID=1871053 RepID=UPI002E367781|nr:VacJ family lipoprotein [Phenylobacterium sp.]HEX3367568.1 VacJ family lipoprotein [Phenylobacterium sp.]
MQSSSSRLPLALPLIAAAFLATPCRAADPSDPLESMNRRFFGMEEALDRHLLGPIAHSFGAAPSPLRRALRNFGRNLGEPVVVVNDLLQGRVAQAAGTVVRIVVNTTFGVGGLLDVAKKNHLPHHDNSFGTTLGRWGAGPGPYLFIPLVGPTTFRDAFGSIADIGLNPLTYVRYRSKTEIDVGVAVIQGLGERLDGERDLATIRETSTDPYATLRSYFLQNRQAEITGKTTDIGALPDLDSPEAAPAKPASPTDRPPNSPPPAGPTSPPSDEAATPPQREATPDAPKAQAPDQPPS